MIFIAHHPLIDVATDTQTVSGENWSERVMFATLRALFWIFSPRVIV